MKKLLSLLLVIVFALALVPAASAQGDLGSEGNPIEVYFVPSVEAQTIVEGGEIMRAALEEATGLTFEVYVPTSYAATIEAMCAAPDSSMGFIPAAGYVLASDRCGIEVGAAAVRRGWPVYFTEYLVRRDSGIYTFGDLDGKVWAYPDAGSTSGFFLPSAEFAAAGITPSDTVEAGGHPQAVLAVYNGEADVATAYFSPPAVPGAPWDIGDLADPYDLTVDQSYVTDEGLFVGDVQILDARAAVRDTAPDVVDKVRILRLSAPIPNDTLSFGPDFPVELRTTIIDALIAFSQTEEWAQSIGNEDFYGWSGLTPVGDENYNSVRAVIEFRGLTAEDVFGEG